jgi:threonine aldolase
MDAIDYRSDTITPPTPAMREAMKNAVVGDDGWGDDPTVIELQAEAADMFGMEAGLFVTSGSLGNLTATMAHCQRGDAMILAREAHIITHEYGGHPLVGGITPYMLSWDATGKMDLDEIRASIHPAGSSAAITRLICLENTAGNAYGAALDRAYIEAVIAMAREHNLKVHVDGARIFNAATVLNTSVKDLTRGVDSLTFCLSKGLCAPVGSILMGSQDFIERAHRIRNMLGGGMRQAGVLAAPGLIALRDMSGRLHEDHATARLLAEELAKIPHIQIDLTTVHTNMVFFSLSDDAPLDGQTLSERLESDYNILMRSYDPRGLAFRAVTHYYITREHIETTIATLRTLLGVGEQVTQ